jgi:hypothetical protein
VTSPSLLSDAQAREIARSIEYAEGSPLGRLVATGEITEGLLRLANWCASMSSPRRAPGEHTNSLDRRRRLFDLYGYVAFHGERPAQDGWGER